MEHKRGGFKVELQEGRRMLVHRVSGATHPAHRMITLAATILDTGNHLLKKSSDCRHSIQTRWRVFRRWGFRLRVQDLIKISKFNILIRLSGVAHFLRFP
jgi:hypothetical protein